MQRRRRRIIDDSDGDAPEQKLLQSEGVIVFAPVALDRDAPDLVEVLPLAVVVAADLIVFPHPCLLEPQVKMNPYFQQFPACRHAKLEPPLPLPAPDADTMDLRKAVPPVSCQYLDECQHMPCNSDDTSGSTGSDGSEDGSSFIDDEPIPLTAADLAFIQQYTVKDMPRTSARLLAPPDVKIKRPWIVSSSSSASMGVSDFSCSDDGDGPPELVESLAQCPQLHGYHDDE